MKMLRIVPGLSCLAVILAAAATSASECCDGPVSCVSCTGAAPCCEPRCKAEWDKHKTKETVYSMKCEYACARAWDPWHAPDPECRCRPPCGNVYVKKRFYKSEGKEKVERVPKYEVEMVPAEPCACPRCHGGSCWWLNPLNLFSLLHSH